MTEYKIRPRRYVGESVFTSALKIVKRCKGKEFLYNFQENAIKFNNV